MNYDDDYNYRGYTDPQNNNRQIYYKIKKPKELKPLLDAAKAISKAKEYLYPIQKRRERNRRDMREIAKLTRLSLGRELKGPITARSSSQFIDNRLNIQYDYDKKKEKKKKLK